MKGILFSTSMVQAILRNEKSQTRRIVKEAIGWDYNWRVSQIKEEHLDGIPRYEMRCGSQYSTQIFKSRYQVGDVLYVRETWAPESVKSDVRTLTRYIYNADGSIPTDKWKPSRFMPQAAARIFLKVTNVRCERLQDITEQDAIAEGIAELLQSSMQLAVNGRLFRDYSKKIELFNDGLTAIQSYRTLWESINGKGSWNENPYVWVYEFERIEKPEEEQQ